jgi:pimeloyl-ACP methyl ester carboxylesterase
MIAPLAALFIVADTVIRFQSGSMNLEGTLLLPEGRGPWPAVVIIAGSGPTDRDGNSLIGGVAPNTYRMLAEGLAAKGVASFRYDKRGLPSSRGTMDMRVTTLLDFARDAAVAAGVLRARSDIGPIALLGHSEGGTLALLAAQDGAAVEGLVLVATAGRDPTTILREQLSRTLAPALIAAFDTAWARYINTDSAVAGPPELAPLFVPVNRAFLKSWQAVDPQAILRGLDKPVLVVQGETDVQITPVDARALAGARAGIRLVLLPGTNHVLKLATGNTAAEQMASYTDRTLPLAPGVAEPIAEFVLQLRR